MLSAFHGTPTSPIHKRHETTTDRDTAQALQFRLQPQKGLDGQQEVEIRKLWECRRCKAPAGVARTTNSHIAEEFMGMGKKSGREATWSARGVLHHTRTQAKAPRTTCTGYRGQSKRTRKQSSIAWASGAARSGLECGHGAEAMREPTWDRSRVPGSGSEIDPFGEVSG